MCFKQTLTNKDNKCTHNCQDRVHQCSCLRIHVCSVEKRTLPLLRCHGTGIANHGDYIIAGTSGQCLGIGSSHFLLRRCTRENIAQCTITSRGTCFTRQQLQFVLKEPNWTQTAPLTKHSRRLVPLGATCTLFADDKLAMLTDHTGCSAIASIVVKFWLCPHVVDDGVVRAQFATFLTDFVLILVFRTYLAGLQSLTCVQKRKLSGGACLALNLTRVPGEFSGWARLAVIAGKTRCVGKFPGSTLGALEIGNEASSGGPSASRTRTVAVGICGRPSCGGKFSS